MPETRVRSDLAGMVWKVEVSVGDRVAEGDTLVLIESMKMEIPVPAPCGGTVSGIFVKEEQQIAEGEILAAIAN